MRRPKSPNRGEPYGRPKAPGYFLFERIDEGDKVRGIKAASTKISQKAAKEKPFLDFVDGYTNGVDHAHNR